jgi:ABC-2 type transport system permease protein
VVNVVGTWWLFRKESLRFLKVSVQTILAPMMTSLLYLVVFASVLDENIAVYDNKVAYNAFLVPGLVIMTVMQNAFSNASSSLIQSKMNGNIVFMFLAPLSGAEIFVAYALACILRGVIVGVAVLLGAMLLVEVTIIHPWIALFFTLASAAWLGMLGIIAGVMAEKFDHLSAFQNFIVMPLTFLSGVFYSISDLSPTWQKISQINPMLYLIDGFRYGFIGHSDIAISTNIIVAVVFVVVTAVVCVMMLGSGYKLRN